MNILNIKYCAQDLSFEEKAYKSFETYEQELKEYFLEQADGYDIFEDLKLRICEMLQSKMKNSGAAITEEDVEEIKKSIGYVKQLESMEDEEETDYINEEPAQQAPRDKKLYRNENETMVAGVCGGLGNYFSIDPLAFRLLFVLVTLFSTWIGVLAYVIFWAVLKSKALPTNLSKRLYRNGADKVIAGVCGGLASFFNTEAWIVRVIFLSPLILNITTQGVFNFGFSLFNGSAMGFALISYIILWITTKESETPTEELLARGEDININSISVESEKAHNNPDKNSGFNNVLRIIAFVIIGLALAGIFVFLVVLIFGSIFMLPLTGSILHTPLLKWLGGLSVIFFFLLPLIAFVVWAIRRLKGTKGPNKTLRTSFGALWGLGLTSAIVLALMMVSQINRDATISERIDLPVQGDTLFVDQLNSITTFSSMRIKYRSSFINNFYERTESEQRSRLVSFNKKESKDGSFYVMVEKTAWGKGDKGAAHNANLTSIKNEFKNDHLYIAKYVSIPKEEPFRFQDAKVTFYIPKGKVLVVEPGIRMRHYGKRNSRITYHSDWEDLDEKTKEKIGDEMEEVMDEVGEAFEEIGEAFEEVGTSIEKAGGEIGDLDEEIRKEEKQSAENIRIEKQRSRVRKEQLRLKKLERERDAKKVQR